MKKPWLINGLPLIIDGVPAFCEDCPCAPPSWCDAAAIPDVISLSGLASLLERYAGLDCAGSVVYKEEWAVGSAGEDAVNLERVGDSCEWEVELDVYMRSWTSAGGWTAWALQDTETLSFFKYLDVEYRIQGGSNTDFCPASRTLAGSVFGDYEADFPSSHAFEFVSGGDSGCQNDRWPSFFSYTAQSWRRTGSTWGIS